MRSTYWSQFSVFYTQTQWHLLVNYVSFLHSSLQSSRIKYNLGNNTLNLALMLPVRRLSFK